MLREHFLKRTVFVRRGQEDARDAARERRRQTEVRRQRANREGPRPAPDFGIDMQRAPTVDDLHPFEFDVGASVLMWHEMLGDDVVSTPLPPEATDEQRRVYEAALLERCKVTADDAQECVANYRQRMSHM